ncbi:hypothetical protein B9G69_003070 [Bdellovibrio sp. SKB1291214]|uniref:hypothetical protein n=1 Tax=Bdellovibrio sp. SKB1291214 TaxID=1732569 RepID=UPI000B51C0DE|nr:hypothetical protein [Bdellovibrio sp. SKB1291214]UYL09552.1 hypothetical protein B9G69_003070 [Bdellovibrio sp. SKB1291214]
MSKSRFTAASIGVALVIGYFSGKKYADFTPRKVEVEDLASTSKIEFETLKLKPLPSAKILGEKPLRSLKEAADFIEPYHERHDFKWHPGYSVSAPSFDSKNRPYFRYHDREQTIPVANGFQTLREGSWTHYPFMVGMLLPFYDEKSQDIILNSKQDILWDPKMAVFDKTDRMYTVLRMKTTVFNKDTSYVMMYSDDQGLNWSALPLVGTKDTGCVFRSLGTNDCPLPQLYDLERPYNRAPLQSPPAMLYFLSDGKLPGFEKTYSWLGTVGKLYLQPISKNSQGKLVAEKPVLISLSAQEIGYRSGSSTKIIRSGNKYFITWLEANREFAPKLDANGNPIIPKLDQMNKPYSEIWIAEYDMKTKKVSKKPILKSWPVNDTHNQPGIVRTWDGHFIVVSGGHGSHFTYTYSLKPDSISAWAPEVPMNTADTGYKSNYSSPLWSGGGQTYISMVIGADDTVHTVYRQWHHDRKIFDFEYFGALVYQNGKFDKRSKTFQWNPARILVYPNASEYTHWYQVMSVDRKDNIYVEYSNMRPYPPYQVVNGDGKPEFISPYLNNALLRSENSGRTWSLVSDDDLKKSQIK